MEYALIFSLVFLLITFGFSTFEKISDFKNSVAYYKTYFKNSFVEKAIKPLLGGIALLEGVTSVLLLVGIAEMFNEGRLRWGFYGIVLSALILCVFLVGQRLVKDYEGARGILLYFLLCLVALVLAHFT